MITLKDIVSAYLREHGYDGLTCDGCACELDDLMPCDEPRVDCSPGYYWLPDKDEEDFTPGEPDFYIGPEKPVADRYLAESEREE